MEAINVTQAMIDQIKGQQMSLTEQAARDIDEGLYRNPNFDFYMANNISGDINKLLKDKRAKLDVVNRFKGNLTTLMNHWDMTIHKKWIQALKDYQLTNIDRALELKRKKMLFLTNEKIPIIRSHADRTIKALFDGKFTGKVYGAQGKDQANNRAAIQHFANWIYASADIRRIMIEVGIDSVVLGNGFLRTGFDPIPLDDEQIAKVMKSDAAIKPEAVQLAEPLALAEYVSPFDIYAEPYTDFYQQPIYHRYIDNLSNVLNNYKNLFTLDDSQIAFITGRPQYFSTKNYNKIKLIKFYEDFIMHNNIGYELDNLFVMNPKSGAIEVIEYEFENSFAILLNGYLVYDGENPYYYEGRKAKHRYKTLVSQKQGGTWVSQGVGISLSGIQKLYDALFNIMFDLAKFAAGPMFVAQPGQWIEGCETQLNYEPFTIKQSRGLADARLQTLELPKPEAVNFTMMNNLLEYANMLISPTTYNQIQTQSRSATDSEYRKEGLKTQLNDLAENYGEVFDSMLKDYLCYAKKCLGKDRTIEILNIKDGEEVWRKISGRNLEGNFIYETEFESLRNINSVLDRNEYLQFMDLVTKIGQDPVTGQFLVDMKKLITKGIELYDQDADIVLADDEYYKMVEEAQTKAQELQKKLADVQQASQAEAQGQQQQEPVNPLPNISAVLNS